MYDAQPPAWKIAAERWFYAAVVWVHTRSARLVCAGGRWLMRLQGRFTIPQKLCAGFVLLALIAGCAGTFAPGWLIDPHNDLPDPDTLGVVRRIGLWFYERLIVKNGTIPADYAEVIEQLGFNARAQVIKWIGWGVAALCLAGAGLTWWRRRLSLWVMKAAWAAYTVFWFALLKLLWGLPPALHNYDYRGFWKGLRNEVWTEILFRFSPLMLVPAVVLLGLVLKAVHEHYKRVDSPARIGDRFLVNVQTGGRDPKFRVAWSWSVTGFLIVLLLPFILHGCGWEAPYGLPPGSGNPVVEMVKVKKVKKEKKKKLVVNKWSPYIFDRIKIDDLKVMVELEQETRDQYEVLESKTGKLGKGGGKTGGWPGGMANSKLRFIRLKYRGGDWDQDMGKGADYNILVFFNKLTGFPIARETEYKEAARLRMFPKDHAPPFIFITGKRGISLNSSEIKTLRWYCTKEGGMLFIDNGGGHFNSAVRSMLAQVFPGKRLIDISNDDPIFKAPFSFPNGAPPLWAHSGTRALGIRHEGRWAVFYHQGDINDAWKDGHSGASDLVAEQALRMGINVIYYAFNEYHRLHFE